MFDDGTLLKSCQKEIYQLRKQLTEVFTNFDSAETFEEFSPSNYVVLLYCLSIDESRVKYLSAHARIGD